MKNAVKGLLLAVVMTAVLNCVPVIAQVDTCAPPNGNSGWAWQKITGDPYNYCGVPDGIEADRENAYVWSMEIHGDYLYVGTMRNVVGMVCYLYGVPQEYWPSVVPEVTDMQGRIYRMKLSTCQWEMFYCADPYPPDTVTFTMGPDIGYRVMKTYKAKYSPPVLYVGGASFGGGSRLLAIDCKHNPPVEVFVAENSESIRAMAEYGGKFFWASDINGQPAIWYSSDPLKDCSRNNGFTFPRIDVPSCWFPKGAEILDMVSWNGCLYVFFFNHDYNKGGFWCCKLTNSRGKWKWQVVVGEKKYGAKYPCGMGRMENGGATPFVFKDKLYVGTLSNTMWSFLHGEMVDLRYLEPTGTQIFRFDKRDKCERVMPPAYVKDQEQVYMKNGFGNFLNLYLWKFAEFKGKLYAGTFDCRSVIEMMKDYNVDRMIGMNMDRMKKDLWWDPAGFDLYVTCDGVNWEPEVMAGLGDCWNYGARMLCTNPKTGDLYLGTANPFYGCQVWRRKAR